MLNMGWFPEELKTIAVPDICHIMAVQLRRR